MKSDAASKSVPKHIGIIMDGNRRWAKSKRKPAVFGHRAGVKNIVPVVSTAFDYGVDAVTLYAFSSENKGREANEVNALVDLIRTQLKPLTRPLIARGSRVMFSGDDTYFPNDVRKIMAEIASENTDKSAQVVNIALNYGSRNEIVRAATLAARSGEITAQSFEKCLYTAELPDPDMIIRTGGEKRLSNFLMYQAAYSELFFTDTLWPDFGGDELLSLFDEFNHRTRRFGKL